MKQCHQHPFKPTRLAVALCCLSAAVPAFAQQVQELESIEVIGTAAQELKQAPGVSIISAQDIQDHPPANDLSELIRKQPGVNLTGNSTSGQRGNNRQIDIRGMGPENTLILIDGRPVSSRNSVRYGWRGERDTRGDSNWVPAQAVERIEVLRGPAAARYGSGAAGGVVNIITKGVPDALSGFVTLYTNQPESSKDGDTRRISLGLGGPLSARLGFQVYANAAKTDADASDINRGHQSWRGIAANGTNYTNTFPAGREGVRNRDVSGKLTLLPAAGHRLELDAAFSRQGNIYTGDTQNTNNNTVNKTGQPVPTSKLVQDNLGAETNIMYREMYALTHRATYDFGSSMAYVQYEKTRNRRLKEGLAGGTEGLFDSMNPGYDTSVLRSYTVHGELNLPGQIVGRRHVLTIGSEWVGSKLDDPSSMTQNTTEGGAIPGLNGVARSTSSAARIVSVFVEDNIELSAQTTLTPGLRYDHHSDTGSNWSPALNLSHYLTDQITIKAGIARAYKAPNLYQTNKHYLLYSRGIGCHGGGGACYLRGNSGLKAETSINKELGIEFANDTVLAGLTYFRNDYRDKIESGRSPVAQAIGGTGAFANADIFQWDNVPKALIEGLEGTFSWALSPTVNWSNNFTHMLRSKNKTTGEALSTIPAYTLNSRIDWKATSQLGLHASVTWYGSQKSKKYDFQGKPLLAAERRDLSPYALVGIGGSYQVSKHFSLTAGISNLFDKRLYRRGNAVGVGDPRTIHGAGAATYNEPGRSYYLSMTASF